MISGNILKLRSKVDYKDSEDIIKYSLPLGDQEVDLNNLIGKNISMKFSGVINCLETDKKIKKSYGQGYSWESFITLARCDKCIFQPELCHYSSGTCREPEWGEQNCLKPHVIYLANTSSAKIGITRQTQVPTRWVDQGASFALPIAIVDDRLTSGILEVEVAKIMADKTNWRKMLKNEIEDVNLEDLREMVWDKYGDLFRKYKAQKCDDSTYKLNFPVQEYPLKVSSLGFDKKPLIEGVLKGIKGQYLILDCGVINMRKHQGYFIEFVHE